MSRTASCCSTTRDRLYLRVLQQAVAEGDERRVQTLMRDAIGALLTWQLRVAADSLPPYDEALLRRELALFPEWCVARHCQVDWTEAERGIWQSSCDLLVASALAQQRVAVHRDWMPRNLMVADPNPGILDFQDAVAGPITYDVASLLRDAFISWSEEEELDWAVRYWDAARQAGLPGGHRLRRVLALPRRMGLKRHLKVLASSRASPPRRQAGIQRGPAPLLRLRAQDGDTLRAAAPAGAPARAADGRHAHRSLPLTRPRRERPCCA